MMRFFSDKLNYTTSGDEGNAPDCREFGAILL